MNNEVKKEILNSLISRRKNAEISLAASKQEIRDIDDILFKLK